MNDGSPLEDASARLGDAAKEPISMISNNTANNRLVNSFNLFTPNNPNLVNYLIVFRQTSSNFTYFYFPLYEGEIQLPNGNNF